MRTVIKAILTGILFLQLCWMHSALAQTGVRNQESAERQGCEVSLLVLGVAQDGGKPQLANPDDPAWRDSRLQRLAASVAVIDQRGEQVRRWLFDATPDFKQQLQHLDQYAPAEWPIGLDGIFLTHAHIGHYSGLLLLGHEAAGARQVVVYAMPRMDEFLSSNGPWDQLIRYRNIQLQALQDNQPVELARNLQVTPFTVPHRQEYSEVVGFRIQGPGRSVIYLPDIDSWEAWDKQGTRIETVLAENDLAFIDATFYDDGELPGRDMRGFPHPLVSHSMQRLAGLAAQHKAKVHFIHLNHTNPLHVPGSVAAQTVKDKGFRVAREGQSECL